jgi:DNA-binding transcriptional regulator YiaG
MTPEQFKAKREALGLTQSQLAEILGMSSSLVIRRWEMPSYVKSSRPPNPIACKVLENWDKKPADWGML